MIEAAKCLLEKEDAGGGGRNALRNNTHGSMIHPKVMNVHEYCLENLFVYFGEV